ncbi:MAG: 50S ribosomal protein L24 [Candidatus Magasanikbacteria bacterium]|nr:50S ribosomal protein L24 [Candidatus Magasanikbacteria bacterium]
MKLRKGDKVIVISGKDKGKTGKIIQVFPQGRIVVEGVNVLKKHARAKREGQKGQVIELPAPLDVSNVLFFCERCNRGIRLGYRLEADKKTRLCRKCGEAV